MSKTKVIDLHKQLLAEWAKEDKRNLDKIAETITQLKEILNDITVLDTLEAKQALTINRDVVELTLLLSAARATPTSSLNDFEEAAAHASAFYSVAGGDSPNQAHITGLRLMHLLATHRLVDFHVLLEEIPINDRTQNPYIASPVKLEQSMVEGAYHKVVLTEKNLPSPFYNVFIAILLETIRRVSINECLVWFRDEVAQNIEGAFQKIPVGEAARLLLFDTTEKAKSFASKRGWKLVGNFYEFTKTKEEAVQHLDTNGLVGKSLYYAKQLEKIV